VSCSKCEGGNGVKDGVVKGRQRYLCKAVWVSTYRPIPWEEPCPQATGLGMVP